MRFKVPTVNLRWDMKELLMCKWWYQRSTSNYLQISTIAVSGVNHSAHFELVKFQSQDPISWCAPKAAESIPASQRTIAVEPCNFRRGHIHLNVNRLIAEVLVHLVFFLRYCSNVPVGIAVTAPCGQIEKKQKRLLPEQLIIILVY